MPQPYLIEIWKGENLYEEYTILDENEDARDLTNATLSQRKSC